MRAAAIAFLGGILIVQQLAVLPSPAWALLLLPVLLVALRYPRALALAFLIAGVAWASWRAGLILQEQLSPELEGRDIVVEGNIAELPQPTEYGTRFVFDVKQARVDTTAVTVPRRIRLSADHDVDVHVGETWRFTVRLKRPHGLQNPGGFDYEAYLFRQRLRATGYVRAQPTPQRMGAGADGYRLHRLRQGLGERMRSLMPDEPYGGLLVALANGDSGGITDAQWDTLRATGTLHLVAISGLHISLIAGVFYWLARLLWSLPAVTLLRLPAQFAGAIAGLIAATTYAALAGFVVPTQRALIMLAVAMGAILLRRRVPPSRLLAVALLLVLAFDPMAVMAPGFWLSYAAVAVIVYVVHGERGAVAWWRRLGGIQWAIALGMLPLTLWLFQRVSLVAPFANLLAVPVFDVFVVPITLLGAFFSGVGMDASAGLLFQLGGLLLHGLWQALTFLAGFDHAQWVQHRPAPWAFACALTGIAILLAPRGWPARAIGIVWLLPMFMVHPAAPAAGEVWFTLLDVGQGLAAVVRTGNHVLVFDSGPRWSPRSDAGRSVVVPYLRAQGIARIDTLFVSHGDNDHAGGVYSITGALPVVRIVSGASGVAGERCHAGQHWSWDGIDFTVLNPIDTAQRHNDASCVLSVHSTHGTILLSADIEAAAERYLLKRESGALRAQILVAPHHGSRTSSTPAFIEAVHPEFAVFPVGYRNRYHHPHASVVERYRERGIRCFDTATSGAVEFKLHAGGIEVAAYRVRHRRYWQTVSQPP